MSADTQASPTPETDTETVRVELAERAYDIFVGENVLATAADKIRTMTAGRKLRAAVVSDETVAKLHLPTLTGALDAAGIDHQVLIVPVGEATKSFGQFENLVDGILAARIERGDIVIALGGGVVGDLAGFAAAVVRRGIDVVQAPTTLLAQVDSSIGGKTAINSPRGKNLVGVFHQPSLVLADIGVLETLPMRDIKAGFAEVLKYGLINDADFFAWLESNGEALLSGDTGTRREAVIESCRSKSRIVAADEREGGVRALLNLGHTFGHALEAEMGYGDGILHGEAVGIGMRMAFDLSARLGLCPQADADRVYACLRKFGMAATVKDIPGHAQSGEWQAERLLHHMRQDKKVTGGQLTFVLARGIGEAFITREVAEADLVSALKQEIAGAVRHDG